MLKKGYISAETTYMYFIQYSGILTFHDLRLPHFLLPSTVWNCRQFYIHTHISACIQK